MEEQTILDMCQSHNVKVSIEYDRGWAEWVIEVSSRNTRNPIKHTYKYKRIDIEASGIGTYEYLRQRIVLEIAKDFQEVNIVTQEQYLMDQNDGLKNKVKSLEEEIRHLQWEKDYLAKQVEHLQSCLDLEKDTE